MTKRLNRIIAAVLVFAVLFVIANSFRTVNSPYIKYTARVGTYVVSVRKDALIVKDEYIVAPDKTGIMEPAVSEGERVAAYSRLGAVITGDIDPVRVNELKNLNNEIDALNKTLSEAGILTIADDKVSSTLELSLDKLRYAAAKNDLGEAVVQCDNVRILAERKAGITSSSIAQATLADTIAKRDAVAAGLGGSHTQLYAPLSGIYSSNVDGMEAVLTTQWAKAPTPQSVNEYFERLESAEPVGVCKIINNYKWYAVLNLTKDECEGLNIGEEYTVKFKSLNETELAGKVAYISEPSDEGLYALTLEFNNYIGDFTSIRKVSIEICKETYSGIYIPRSAVRVNTVQGVWVQNEVSLEFKSIVEVYRSDDFLLVKENADGQGEYRNISLYDNIVLNPDK